MEQAILVFLELVWFNNVYLARLIQDCIELYPVVQLYVSQVLTNPFFENYEQIEAISDYIHLYCSEYGYPDET
ncbi:hypothetical protein [Endozoicomonas sp. ALD040]|uniref:hypothetical protein n=1 Tax=unclassified Endozoicomonas TaxID=2644528 RepID=UPI003BB0628B